MSIVEEFFTFFNDLIIGSSESSDSDDEIIGIIESSSVMNSLSAVVSRTISQYENSIIQDFNSDQKIVVDCGSARLTPWHLKKRGKKYNWLGEEIPNSGCVNFGCCYDITQTADIKLSAINETTVENHQQMFNVIKQELTNQVSMVVGLEERSLNILNAALNEVETISVDHIRKHLRNITGQDLVSSQEINVIPLSPLRCKNSCGEDPTAGFINQSLNVEVAAENIITDIVESITQTYITMKSETDVSVTTVDMKKIYIFAILSVLLIVALYTVCYLIVQLIHYVIAKRPAKEIVAHIGATILMVLVYLFWGIVVCIVRSGGGFKMMFCMF
jgi:hypothetical protein